MWREAQATDSSLFNFIQTELAIAMAQDNEDSSLEIDVDPIEHMKARLKRQQIMLFAALGVGTVSLIAAIAAITLVFMATPDNSDATEELASTTMQLQAADEAFNARFDTILARSNEAQSQLQAISNQLAQLDVNDQRNVIVRVQRILIRQEQDYRDFLTALENGMYNFHMMVPHSRGWWDDYQKELLEAAELSKARENYVVNLRNN